MTSRTSCGTTSRDLAEAAGERRVDGAAVEQEEPDAVRGRAARRGAMTDISNIPSAISSPWPTISRLRAALRAEDGGGRVLDGDRLAEPGVVGLGRLAPVGRPAGGRRAGGSCDATAGRFPSKTICAAGGPVPGLGQLAGSARGSPRGCVVGEPDDLEEVVPLDHAVRVVVDRLAGAGQQPGGASSPR